MYAIYDDQLIFPLLRIPVVSCNCALNSDETLYLSQLLRVELLQLLAKLGALVFGTPELGRTAESKQPHGLALSICMVA